MAAHDCDLYFPYDAGAGSDVLESQWRLMSQFWLMNGPIRGELNDFGISVTAGRNVIQGSGRCWVQGALGELSNAYTQAFATNTSGSTRIDLIVLRNDFTANKVVVDVLQGTPSGSPTVPAVTQNTAMWEEPLFAVTLVNAYTAIASTDWVDLRQFAQGRPPGGPTVIACAVPGSTLSIFTSTWTAFPFTGTEDYDTGAIHAGSPSSHFTVPPGCSGLWTFGVAFAWDNSAVGDRGIQIWKNGSLHSQGPILAACTGSGIDTVMAWDYEDEFVVGDYIQWYVSQDTGGPLDLISARATARYLGPLRVTPGQYPIAFTRGDDYLLTLTFTDDSTPPLPLFWTDMTFVAQIRRFEDDAAVAATFTIDDTDLASGILVLTLADTVTAMLAGGYVWDLQMTDGNGFITTLLAGQVSATRDVSRVS